MTDVDLPALPGVKDAQWIVRTERDYPPFSIEKGDYLCVADEPVDEPHLVVLKRDGLTTVLEHDAGVPGEVLGHVVALVRSLA